MDMDYEQFAGPGPWVLPGQASQRDDDRDWQIGFKRETTDDQSKTWCTTSRMIGPIPNSVYGTSSLKYTWGEISGFVDIKSGTTYSVKTGYRIFNDEKAPL